MVVAWPGASSYSAGSVPLAKAGELAWEPWSPERVKELTEALGEIGAERLFLAAGLSLLDELDAQALGTGAKAMDDRIRSLENRAATLLTDAAARIEMLSRRVDEAS